MAPHGIVWLHSQMTHHRYVVIICIKQGAPPGSASITTKSLTNFYSGIAVVYKALGNHVVALEIMDSM